jgi:hypothetical protein
MNHFRLSAKVSNETIRLLDAIALYLLNNTPGDAVAVGLNATSGSMQFVLARDITPTPEDIRVAHEFFNTVDSSSHPRDILVFPLQHSLCTLS